MNRRSLLKMLLAAPAAIVAAVVAVKTGPVEAVQTWTLGTSNRDIVAAQFFQTEPPKYHKAQARWSSGDHYFHHVRP